MPFREGETLTEQELQMVDKEIRAYRSRRCTYMWMTILFGAGLLAVIAGAFYCGSHPEMLHILFSARRYRSIPEDFRPIIAAIAYPLPFIVMTVFSAIKWNDTVKHIQGLEKWKRPGGL